jgi:hypothetical protein
MEKNIVWFTIDEIHSMFKREQKGHSKLMRDMYNVCPHMEKNESGSYSVWPNGYREVGGGNLKKFQDEYDDALSSSERTRIVYDFRRSYGATQAEVNMILAVPRTSANFEEWWKPGALWSTELDHLADSIQKRNQDWPINVLPESCGQYLRPHYESHWL